MLQFLRVLRGMQLPYIVFTVHSSSLQIGGNGAYTNTREEQERLLSQVSSVLRTLAGWPDFQPATVSEIAQSLEESYHASARN